MHPICSQYMINNFSNRKFQDRLDWSVEVATGSRCSVYGCSAGGQTGLSYLYSGDLQPELSTLECLGYSCSLLSGVYKGENGAGSSSLVVFIQWLDGIVVVGAVLHLVTTPSLMVMFHHQRLSTEKGLLDIGTLEEQCVLSW